jgi:hypothetical protein
MHGVGREPFLDKSTLKHCGRNARARRPWRGVWDGRSAGSFDKAGRVRYTGAVVFLRHIAGLLVGGAVRFAVESKATLRYAC